MKTLHVDYLIVGAGASGMAFADIVLSESDKTIALVDRQDKPGGHWNDAYSFVTLHQPSSFYGVSSKELSKGNIDQVGLNSGFHELASGTEILAYYDDLMREVFLPSGRVTFLSKSEYLGDGRVRNLLTGEETTIRYSKIVDATYYKTAIPATHKPAFSIDAALTCIPPNALPKQTEVAGGFVIIGAGKTAIDTVIWLLQHGVKPNIITWIMPRDAWMLNRKTTQPSNQFFNDTIGAQAAQMEAIAACDSVEDLFLRLEAAGIMLRIDSAIFPPMFHGATISEQELAEIKRIKNIVRMGRVVALTETEIILQQGTIPTSTDVVHVDCSASAITNLAISTVFVDNKITLQTIRAYQPVFSAALIAHIDLTYNDLEKKNQLSKVVPLPNHTQDWVKMTYKNMMNQYFWSKEPGLKQWLLNNRLDGFMSMVSGVRFYQLDKLQILNRMRKAAKPAVAKLKQLSA
ncbi:NAD(P)-binding protein [Alteromonas sp. ASW11-36]|uniref:NAD(P)-binding protein n=1 Tax=Alteromonas arenosi TaxID=3055817 RepID=A0ABT7SW06_9ALTE|nr:NAD(P)-binding protein [Alteromonas sp. ASW11-36]MDM7860381.1 NAD(P)-binding protein [Alteromonas sp. ASW11-36]